MSSVTDTERLLCFVLTKGLSQLYSFFPLKRLLTAGCVLVCVDPMTLSERLGTLTYITIQQRHQWQHHHIGKGWQESWKAKTKQQSMQRKLYHGSYSSFVTGIQNFVRQILPAKFHLTRQIWLACFTCLRAVWNLRKCVQKSYTIMTTKFLQT